MFIPTVNALALKKATLAFFLLMCWFAVLTIGTPASASTPSVNYKILHHFDGLNTGSDPYGIGLTLGKDGNFYGTTLSGGRLPNGAYGEGVVYKIDASGRYSVLHAFDGIAGGWPTAAVTLAEDGSVYGTTYIGGKQKFDTGTVYKIDPAGKFSLIHRFDIKTEGRTSSEVALGPDGGLYGTTFTYGTGVGAKDPATIFKITPTGKYQVIHRFNTAQRELPVGGLIKADDSSFYGISAYGAPVTKGSIYKIGLDGSYQVLYQFTKAYHGSPDSSLTVGPDGNIYGTTSSGGIHGLGTVYKIDPAGNYSILHHFDGISGVSPRGVTFGKDGKLYGVAGSLVDYGYEWMPGPSFLYKLGLDRSFSVLGAFKTPDAQSKLTLARDGNLYGTERSGGKHERGTIFRINFPANPKVMLSASKLTLKQGEALTLTALVNGAPNPTGVIAFIETKGGVSYLGLAAIKQGKAIATLGLTAGVHRIYARYISSSNPAGVLSQPLTVTVLP